LIIVLALAILAAGYYFSLAPQYEEIKRATLDAETARQELNKLVAISNNIKKSREEYGRLRADLQDVLRQMPEEKEVPGLLRQVSITAQESRLRGEVLRSEGRPGSRLLLGASF